MGHTAKDKNIKSILRHLKNNMNIIFLLNNCVSKDTAQKIALKSIALQRLF